MRLVFCNRRIATSAATAIFLLCCSTAHANSITTAPKANPTSNSTQTCKFRTINYITDTLPQQCLKSAWSNSNGTASVKSEGSANATSLRDIGNVEGSVTSLQASTSSTGPGQVQNAISSETLSGESLSSSSTTTPSPPDTAEASTADLESGELNDASFLSFEEWKKQTLEKVGQHNANIGNKRSGENKKRDSESFQNNLDSLGDEGEIALDFGAFRSGKKGEEGSQTSQTGEPEVNQETQGREVKKKDQYRSKDAGKTCKERFSYASFDAGATILKTHPGAKNSKAVLIENKDSYMLSECAVENKFLIIELSEDIWIDTLVLANYEFFSSMIQTFRVSVSDRYPVKMEKWKDLGTYEARNSREIQAFLIENPQIWARYIRIEFLSHYGNEYYCPLSLVRVHGARMLESWKEMEANNEEDEDPEDVDEASAEDRFIPEAVAMVVQEEERMNAELKEAQAAIEELVKTAQNITSSGVEPALNSSHLEEVNAALQDATIEQLTTPWIPGFDFGAWMNVSKGLDVCLPKEAPPSQHVIASTASVETVTSFTGLGVEPATTAIPPETDSNNSTVASSASENEIPTPAGNTTMESASTVIPTPSNLTASSSSSNSTASISSAGPSIPTKPQNITSSVKNKTTSTFSSPSSLPTQQESFFKAVSRRLQLLETNSTLSLKYIEEQSKILREAFTKVEKKQLLKTTNFLDTLNITVLTELKEIRQQYDEIWQSTVISLESQRDESRRKILAISTRLNILADEVVFQKRMSIVQSVLLLLCLGLVIFSRVSSSPLDFSSRTRNFNSFPIECPIESPSESPECVRSKSIPTGRHWVEAGHRRKKSDDSIMSREGDEEGSRDDSPPTPVSSYSGKSLSPPSRGDTSSPYRVAEHLALPQQSTNPLIPIRTSSYNEPKELPESSPVRAPKKRKGFIRQQVSPPANENMTSTSTNGSPLSQTPPRVTFGTPQQITQQPPIISTTPAAPPPSQSPSQEGSKHRQSFGIARKPLPALPKDTGSD